MRRTPKSTTRRHERPSKVRRAGNLRGDSARAERKRIKFVARVARDYWLYGKTQAEIAKTLDVHQSTVMRHLKQAEVDGLVEVRVDEGFAAGGKQDAGLGKRLRDLFDIDDCVAVDVLLLDPYNRSEDEYLHHALARYAGERLQMTVETGMHVCVSGGRAAHHAARVFARKAPSRKNVRITPLCGRVWAHSWEPRGPGIMRPVDADDVAVVLASALAEEPGTVFSQVIYPLFAADEPEASAIMKDHCRFLPTGKWRDNDVPDRALVGVGGIHPEGAHRFMDLIRHNLRDSEITPHLESAAGQLQEADRFAVLQRLPRFGDVGNRLYPVLPLPDEIEAAELERFDAQFEKLNERINEINSRMVIANWRHLRDVRRVMAVAGGPWKINAIWTLLIAGYLNKRLRIVSELCTDSRTASTLADALDRFSAQPAVIRDWYGRVTERVFAG